MLIAILKLLKALVLIVTGGLALWLANHYPPEQLHKWAQMVGVNPYSEHWTALTRKVAGTSHHKLEEIGIGTFFYAVLFLVEGVGLLLQKRWAEYLTIIITSSFIPFEIYELVKDFSAGKIVVIVLNAIAVAYLVFRVHARKSEAGKARAPATA